MKLYQYWDTGKPPVEVAGWIEGFRAMNPDMKHRLYDRDRASWFIGKHVGERERRAFDAIAVPSMQSDYWRYCAVWAFGGVYVDADFQALRPFSGLLQQAPHSLMLSWGGHLLASLMMCRQRRNPFIRACLDLSTANIEARALTSAYTGAGPGVISAVGALIAPESFDEVAKGFDNFFGRGWGFPELMERARSTIVVTPEMTEAFQAMTVIHAKKLNGWIGRDAPAYKETERHWLHWQGSLYVDAGDGAPAEPA